MLATPRVLPMRTTLSHLSAVLAASALLFAADSASAATLINNSFEEPRLTPGVADWTWYVEGAVPGWETTASDNLIEIWSDGYSGVTSYHGDQHAELNANKISALFQNVNLISAGTELSFEFAHRGRGGVDTMELQITDLGADNVLGGTGLDADTDLFTGQYSTGNTAWAFYTSAGLGPIIARGNAIQFSYAAISAAGGATVGNFLDAVNFGTKTEVENAGVPEPSTIALLSVAGAAALAKRRRS